MSSRQLLGFALISIAFPAYAQAPGAAPPPGDPAATQPAGEPAAPPANRIPPVPDPSAHVGPAAPANQPALPPPETLPPPAYYLEPPGQPAATPHRPAHPHPPAHPPHPPRIVIWEPPPPPPPLQPIHVAPKTSLWGGVRLGWFVPFGGVYARGDEVNGFLERRSVPWRDFVSSGPVFELQLGARLSRNYNVFALWERAELGRGDGDTLGSPEDSSTDFWGVGLRASSDPDRVGFLTEVALGYRRARTEFKDGSALELTEGVLEARIGIGADIRLSPTFSLSPMATAGVGSFGDVNRVSSDGVATDLIGDLDEHDAHGWFTIGLGAHVDLLGQP
jgi:hypothetical protein